MLYHAHVPCPGSWRPRYRNGKWLLDGAIVNPVPVSVCRALGADVVIAVNLNSDSGKPVLTKPEVLPETQAQEENSESEDNGFWRLLGGGKDYINNMMTKFNQGDDMAPPGILGVMSTSINIMQARLTRARMAGDPPEVLISPKLGNIGVLDFHRAAECIEEGERVTKLMQPQLEEEVLSRL